MFSLYYPLKGWIRRHCVGLGLSWNTLVSPSMIIESFAGYSSMGWDVWSLKVCITSVQDLLAFIVSGEKSGVIRIGLPLYVIDLFSLLLLIFCLYLVHCCSDYHVLGGISFLVQSIWSSVGFLHVHGHLFL